MKGRFHSSFVIAVLLGAVLAPARAHAQDQPPAEFTSWQLPGWTFTPGVTFGWLHDSNVAVTSAPFAGSTASDNLFQMEPFGSLEYYSPRTNFSTNYQGYVRRYVTLDELNSLEQHANVSLRHRLTRRYTLFVSDAYLISPTTDQVELNGVPFQRNGSRYDAASAGLEARVSRTVTAVVRYEFTWVDFERQDALLNGGFVNGVNAQATKALTPRSSLGGEYSVRFANLDSGTRQLSFQNAGAVYRYQAGEQTQVEGAVGVAHLIDKSNAVSRSGLYVRAGLSHRLDRATLGINYERSYVPSFAFGGTNQSQETRGFVMMPLSRNRIYLEESAAWRRTDPLLAQELPLDSIWLHTTVGYAVQRWLRIEGYHAFSRQDVRLNNGQVNRNVIGVQFVVARPVRIEQ